MAILTLLRNWREALIGFLGVAFLLLLTWFKYRGKKRKKLEFEVESKGKELEITKEQKLAIAEIEAEEQDEILKEVFNHAKKSKSDRIDDL